MGSGISNPFEPDGEGSASGGVLGLDCSEEFVEVSPPDEQRDEMSPSLGSLSWDDDLDDFPEDPPRDEPPLEEHAGPMALPTMLSDLLTPRTTGLGGDAAAGVPLLKFGDARTAPSGCCTRSRASLHVKPPPGLLGRAPRLSSGPLVVMARTPAGPAGP